MAASAPQTGLALALASASCGLRLLLAQDQGTNAGQRCLIRPRIGIERQEQRLRQRLPEVDSTILHRKHIERICIELDLARLGISGSNLNASVSATWAGTGSPERAQRCTTSASNRPDRSAAFPCFPPTHGRQDDRPRPDRIVPQAQRAPARRPRAHDPARGWTASPAESGG
jgi:hypothetical protein